MTLWRWIGQAAITENKRLMFGVDLIADSLTG
jgi:hypothetical protein